MLVVLLVDTVSPRRRDPGPALSGTTNRIYECGKAGFRPMTYRSHAND